MNIKKRAKIVAALVKAGYGEAVMEDWNKDGDLALNCEVWCGGDVGHVGDYYGWEDPLMKDILDDFGVKLDVGKILGKFKAHTEWYDAAVLMVYA